MQAPQRSRGPSPFSQLARTHAVILAADAFFTVALAGSLFFVVPLEAARSKVVLYLAITMAPFGIVAPLLGPALDRARSRRVILAAGSCIGRALMCLLLARHLRSLWLYPEAFGVLVLMKGYLVAKSSLVPAVVRSEAELVEANSRLAIVGVLGAMAGGLVAAGIMRLVGGVWVLLLGAVVYVVGAAMVLGVPSSDAGALDAAAPEPRRGLAGIRFASVAMAILRCGVGFLVFLLAFSLKRSGEPAWFYGAVIAISALGGFAGAVLAPMARKLLREEAILVAALAVPTAVAVLSARGSGRWAALGVALALGIGASLGRAGFDSLVQRDAPGTAWGRSFARYEAYFQLAWVIGAFVPTIFPLGAGAGLVVLAFLLGTGTLAYLTALSADRLVAHRTGRVPP